VKLRLEGLTNSGLILGGFNGHQQRPAYKLDESACGVRSVRCPVTLSGVWQKLHRLSASDQTFPVWWAAWPLGIKTQSYRPAEIGASMIAVLELHSSGCGHAAAAATVCRIGPLKKTEDPAEETRDPFLAPLLLPQLPIAGWSTEPRGLQRLSGN
jgi:hypothetical protein